MTRFELKKELGRIESFIDVLKILITKPLCQCVSHLDGFNEKFREENKVQLQELIALKNRLIPLNNQPDHKLQKIQYQPIRFY